MLAFFGLMSVTSAQSFDAQNSSNFIVSSSNDTKLAAEKYFKNLLRKVHGESIEESKIIQTDEELRTAYCSLYNKNNETDGSLDKRDKRIISEMRKLNMKLMKIEDKLEALEKSLEHVIRTEMSTIKEELLRSVGNITGGGKKEAL